MSRIEPQVKMAAARGANFSRRTLTLMLAMLAAATLTADRAHAGLSEAVGRLIGAEEPGRLAVILIDVTGSISSADWTLYERGFHALLAANRPGDRVVLAAIGDQPVSKFIAHADRTIAFRHKRLEDELALKRTNAALVDDFAQLHAQAATPANATFILDTITATGQLFAQARTRHQGLTLLVLSDMIEESPIANFARRPVDEVTGKRLLDARRAQGLLPDLHGVRVYVLGASGNNGQQMARLQRFWSAYFAATSATLQDYGRNPTTIER